ncbi:hypothetical protein A2U01_0056519, partial [Trifolium medium]|nr:hypothetical protein [Trifolium medium]
GLQLQHHRDDSLDSTTIWSRVMTAVQWYRTQHSYPVLLPAVSSAGLPTGPLLGTDYEAARAADAYSERMGPGV